MGSGVELYFYETGLQDFQNEQDTSYGSLRTVTQLILLILKIL